MAAHSSSRLCATFTDCFPDDLRLRLELAVKRFFLTYACMVIAFVGVGMLYFEHVSDEQLSACMLLAIPATILWSKGAKRGQNGSHRTHGGI